MHKGMATVLMQPHVFVVKSTAVTIRIQFEVFKAIKKHIVVLCTMTPCGLVPML
jgi:hypothetical protein